ncbi:hypothetical protein CRG98_004861 [Punica granatum]|uniref:Uncharacterized protein n=1 Tax=Punica granatum TaxID=22663 RepID=A0A2I0L220_PUNGR|nr:hypothetical protein CRG98_004861 [Punica granatum]
MYSAHYKKKGFSRLFEVLTHRECVGKNSCKMGFAAATDVCRPKSNRAGEEEGLEQQRRAGEEEGHEKTTTTQQRRGGAEQVEQKCGEAQHGRAERAAAELSIAAQQQHSRAAVEQ